MTIKQLPSGSWRTQVQINGRRISVTAKTKTEVKVQVARLQSGVQRKNETVPVNLSDAIDQYIDMKSNILSPATIRGYRIIQRNRFQELMSKKVARITKSDLQRAVNIEAGSCSPKTVKNACAFVCTVLKWAGNSIDGIQLPQAVRNDKKYLQPEQIPSLLEAIQGDSCEIEILMAVWLGLRRSEIMGLCWDCVDLERSVVKIRRVMVPDENHRFILKDYPKNTSSARDIPLPALIRDKLSELPRREGVVFTRHPDTIRKHIIRACKTAGVTETTTHGLRHTNAALMRSMAIPDNVAMARGGWSSEQTYKKTYSYVFDSAQDQAADALDSFFSSAHESAHGN